MPWVGLTRWSGSALGAGLSVGVFKDSRPTLEGSLACTKHRALCAAYLETAESLIPAATPLVLLYPETGLEARVLLFGARMQWYAGLPHASPEKMPGKFEG